MIVIPKLMTAKEESMHVSAMSGTNEIHGKKSSMGHKLLAALFPSPSYLPNKTQRLQTRTLRRLVLPSPLFSHLSLLERKQNNDNLLLYLKKKGRGAAGGGRLGQRGYVFNCLWLGGGGARVGGGSSGDLTASSDVIVP